MLQIHGTANRSAMVVTFKSPFFEWLDTISTASSEDLTAIFDEQVDEPLCFLIPEYITAEKTEAYIHEIKPDLFEKILQIWSHEPSDLPDKMNSDTFDEWFEVEYATTVTDLVDQPL